MLKAELGDAYSQHALGLIFYMRLMVEDISALDSYNKTKALYWLKLAHKNNFPLSREVINDIQNN